MLDSDDRSAICARYIQRLNKLQGLLVQDSSIVMERMLKLPSSKREGMARELGKRHILQTLLQPQGGHPGAWKAIAGLGEEFDQLSADKQASRLIWREMEVFVKSATDLTKTEAEYNLLIQRVWEYKTALGMDGLQYEGPREEDRPARFRSPLEHVQRSLRDAPTMSRK
ncbi:hypothetical protein [Hydrogenophaga sp.]|uniref:hypothetical protein n=1 Tax=Hydrogenophaga sp. TaxID=1904254 RepID=UPI0027258945|nr:hypothetical protein [Hydrogenophaga sp.]MDO9437790.1 hypothetical protein [Hydrogenophaga sp.]